MQLTPHFSEEELTRSNTAIRLGLRNKPTTERLKNNLKSTANKMEQVRSILGNRAIIIFSCYRSEAVNRAVGGSPTSSHKDAEAVDFKVVGLSIRDTVSILRNSGIEFDQLIDEFNAWVHIGFGSRNRRQVISARKVRGKTVYKPI